MSWTRQYRPSKISGLHLTNVREQLSKLLANGKFPQVMLFSGPKGTGKTSTARIIAALLNDPQNLEQVTQAYLKPNPKQKSQPLKEAEENEQTTRIIQGKSFMVHEMDAASNRGIDEIRMLKERAALPPQEGLMSVYILDEAHMLTKPAFNALLKLLEEPPAHSLFVLATTEPEKIPDTIISRSHQIRFQQANENEIVLALNDIAKQEKLKINQEALKLIVDQASGSFRDAVKMLELSTHNKQVKLDSVAQFAGKEMSETVWALIDAILAKDKLTIIQLFQNLRANGTSSQNLASSLISSLHRDMIASIQNESLSQTNKAVDKKSGDQAKLPANISRFLLNEFSLVDLSITSPIALLGFELKSLELVFRSQQKNGGGKKPKVQGDDQSREAESSRGDVDLPQLNAQSVGLSHAQKVKLNHVQSVGLSSTQSVELGNDQPAKPSAIEAASQQNTNSAEIKSQKPETIIPSGDSQKLFDHWEDFIFRVSKINSAIAALLQSSRPIAAANGLVTIHVYYKFHQEQLSQPKTKVMLAEAMLPIAGGTVEIDCQLTQAPSKTETAEPEVINSLTQAAAQALM